MEEWRAVRNSFFGVWFKKLATLRTKMSNLSSLLFRLILEGYIMLYLRYGENFLY